MLVTTPELVRFVLRAIVNDMLKDHKVQSLEHFFHAPEIPISGKWAVRVVIERVPAGVHCDTGTETVVHYGGDHVDF